MQISSVSLYQNTYTPVFKSQSVQISGNNAPQSYASSPVYSYNYLPNTAPVKNVFEGMTKKELDFLLQDLSVITTKRGCSHQCLHCIADAKPAGKEHDDYITRMPYEDYVDLMNGLAQLRKSGQTIKHNKVPYTNLYYDADCMELALYDKNGKEHDFIDLHDMLFRSTGAEVIFDTAGWNHKNPKMQSRAEKYVKYLSENDDLFYQINLSMSPFNYMYSRAIELGFDPKNYSVAKLDQEPKSTGEKVYRLYIDQMANMLYTFTPVSSLTNFNIIARPINSNNEAFKQHSREAYGQIRNQVLSRLFQMYNDDYNGERKIVKTMDQAKYFIANYFRLTGISDDNLIVAGRLKDLYNKNVPEMTESDFEKISDQVELSRINFERLKHNDLSVLKDHSYKKAIDVNGRVYICDTCRFIPTELELKLSDNGKETPKFRSEPVGDLVVTKEMINAL